MVGMQVSFVGSLTEENSCLSRASRIASSIMVVGSSSEGSGNLPEIVAAVDIE
jgi:hypothetical protein